MVIPVYLNETAKAATREVAHLHLAVFGMQPEFLDVYSEYAYCIDVEMDGLLYVGDFRYLPENYCRRLTISQDRCTMKQFVAHLFVSSIEQLRDVELPWGILTGIRPQKLYRKLHEAHSQAKTRQIANTLYLIKENKIRLLEQVYDIQRPVLSQYADRSSISLYIGIPYCPSKCSYCTFGGHICSGEAEQSAYFSALLDELRSVLSWIRRYQLRIASVYVGGGTPSTLTVGQIEQLFAEFEQYALAIGELMPLACGEISFEAGRADAISREQLLTLKRMGVERISINPQTFRDHTLRALNRRHTTDDVLGAYETARQIGFSHINMDIILGLPGETVDDVAFTLAQLEHLRPEAITMHALALKTKSTLQRQWELEQFKHGTNIDDMLSIAQPWAKANGYLPYYLYRQKNIAGNMENVGYALPGKHSLYNIFSMEESMPIIGIGCGAVSKMIDADSGKLERLANPVNPNFYIRSIAEVIEKKQKQLPQILTNERRNMYDSD